MPNVVVINGQRYEAPDGVSISVVNGEVRLGNQVVVASEGKRVEVEWLGGEGLASLRADGSVRISGGVSGSVSAGGSVTCGDVRGNVSAGGSIRCEKIGGNTAAGGSIRCG